MISKNSVTFEGCSNGSSGHYDRGERVLLSGGCHGRSLRLGERKLVRLGDIAEVRFGIKTGANEFFYLEDVTDNDMQFSEIKSQIKNLGNFRSLAEIKKAGLRICFNTATEDYWLIEEHFLKSVIKSPRESKSISIKEKALKFKIFLCHEDKKKLSTTHALKYIEWGEIQKFHKRPSCSGRTLWWNLGQKEFWSILWPMIHNDRLAVFLNIDKVAVDHNLFEIKVFNSEREVITIFSLITVLFRELYGRSNLGEGALKTEGIDIVKFMILNPNAISDSTYKRLEIALVTLSKREIKSVFEEVGIDPRMSIRDQEPNPLKDRRIFEDIIFDEFGLTPEERRELYWSVCELVKNRLDKAGSV